MHGQIKPTGTDVEQQRSTMLRSVSAGLKALEEATDLAEVVEIGRKLEAIEHAMRNTGLFTAEQVREANEGRIKARWKLGNLLRQIERGAGPGRGKKVSAAQTSFRAVLKRLDLDKTVAMHAQRIGTLPEPKLEKVLAQYRGTEDFITLNELMIHARPHWYQEKRRDNHERIIRQAAKASLTSVRLGPFGLTYMDAPWRFEVFARDTAQGLPDDHYPTLTDEEIINIRFHGQTIDELAQDDCAMFMWCTSSNLQRALKVMKRLGFDYTPPGATVWRAIPALSYEAVKVALRSFGEGGRDPAPHPKRFGNHVAIAGNAMMISRRTILIAM